MAKTQLLKRLNSPGYKSGAIDNELDMQLILII